ncbi:hypothetical protein INT43_002409 [Umbelopsis isabellina]|uniref:HMG box domain-containing protein n=1 Tax=Mortierella isabellina TaxID=91625 RepID=A0A8H7Q749_MORIS|nr:hypothetical protein INT43_002409 [Umbelopsis isabellina]
MLLEPNPFVKSEHTYYSKASPPTEQLKDAQSAQDQPQPPATPTPSAAIDSIKYENASRRPPAQTMTSLKIPIPRRAEPPSPDMARPPHPSAIPAPGHAQAALRRPAVPIIPKPSTTTQKKGFHVVRYEVRQERYQLHPSAKPGARSGPNHNGPPSSAEGLQSSSGESDDSSDGSGSESDDSDDSGNSEDDDDDSETDAPAAINDADSKKKATTSTKRKRVSRPEGLVKVREEAGSSFMDKNAHIKRPRNAWIHFRCHYGQALKAQDPTLRTEDISNMSSRSLSRRASRRWAKLTDKQKKPWHDLAEQEKQAHKEAFPEYRYCPKRNAKKERQKYKRKQQIGSIMK